MGLQPNEEGSRYIMPHLLTVAGWRERGGREGGGEEGREGAGESEGWRLRDQEIHSRIEKERKI